MIRVIRCGGKFHLRDEADYRILAQMMARKEGIGIDIGGVLAAHATLDVLEGPGRHLAVPEIAGSFDSVGRLQRERFGNNRTFVVSMCSEAIEVKSREWMAYREFCERTGLSWDQIIYCRTFEEKAQIAGEFGLTHFIDDRLEVYKGFEKHLYKKDNLFLFQPKDKEVAEFSQHEDKVTRVESWREILARLLKAPEKLA